jgi:hypothetical protein
MIWSHEAAYDGEIERLKLKSSEGQFDTRMRNSIGDDLTCKNAEFSTKDNDSYYEAWEEKGRGKSYDEEANEAAGKAAADKKKKDDGKTPPPPVKNPPGLNGPIGH